MYWLMSTLPSVTHSVESHGERSEHVDQKDTQLECVSNMAGLEWRSFSLSLSLSLPVPNYQQRLKDPIDHPIGTPVGS